MMYRIGLAFVLFFGLGLGLITISSLKANAQDNITVPSPSNCDFVNDPQGCPPEPGS